jgi:hypothetical protein
MEGRTRSDFELLYPKLEEHRVPWIAIDVRASDGKNAEQNLSVARDTWTALRWLVDVKHHDPKRIGIHGGGVGAVAAVHVAKEHPGDVCALGLMTPRFDYPGYDLEADAHAMPRGAMDVWILCASQDLDKPAPKRGTRHLLYMVKYDRDAPKDTPLDERILKRRGVPPRLYPFDAGDDLGAPGTTMIAHRTLGSETPRMPAIIAAWWARKLGTLPHDVLFDGRVDRKNDFADPGWDEGVAAKGVKGFDARALRWGRRVMVGGEAPRDATSVTVRMRATRGESSVGQIAVVELPTKDKGPTLTVSRLGQTGRQEPIVTDYIAVPLDDVVNWKGEVAEELNPAFEMEFRIPDIRRAEGPLEVRVAFSFRRSAGGVDEASVDLDRPETWVVVPDSLEESKAPPEKAKPPTPPGK